MNQRVRLLLLLAILLAFALRLQHLGVASFWYDETVSFALAQEPAADLITHTARDIHPPGYYLLLRAWLALLPPGRTLEFSSAFLSLCAGVLLLPLTARLGALLRLRPAVLAGAAFLLSMSAFQVWYSQEVRMYTIGAALGLLATWNLWRSAPHAGHAPSPARRRAWLGYVLTAAAGLYTLYYFAFLLAAVNLGYLLTHVGQRRCVPWRAWCAAQAAIILLYLPWLPIAWRQIVAPPVPPWRSLTPIAQAAQEVLLALGAGLTLPAGLAGLILAVILLLAGAAFWRLHDRRPAHSLALPLLYSGLPVLAIYLISVLVTPLYHVRYVFTFAPPFALILASGLLRLWERRALAGRILAAAAGLALIAANLLAIQAAWRAPDHAPDDHRAAVRFLASRWRPGDVILVNAGYAYTALLTYWEQPIAWRGRLSELTPQVSAGLRNAPGAVIVQTGSIEGPESLGWGDPRADFYSLPADLARHRLAEMALTFPRLWQYRIYDTVTDPQGIVRAGLGDWRLFEDDVFSGQASLRVQGFWSPKTVRTADDLAWRAGIWLLAAGRLENNAAPGAGQPLTASLWLRRSDGQPGQALALSLRLFDENGAVWAQNDEPVGGNQRDLRTIAPDETIFQPLRLHIAPGTPPGRYLLGAVLYDPSNAMPVALQADAAAPTPDALLLGSVTIAPAAQPAVQPILASFGPAALVTGQSPAVAISPGDSIPLTLLWQASQAPIRPSLTVVVQLLASDDRVVAGLEASLLSAGRDVSQWLPGEMLLDQRTLTAPAALSDGVYRLVVALDRSTDGQRLRARCGPWPWTLCGVIEIKQIEVGSGESQ